MGQRRSVPKSRHVAQRTRAIPRPSLKRGEMAVRAAGDSSGRVGEIGVGVKGSAHGSPPRTEWYYQPQALATETSVPLGAVPLFDARGL